MLDNIWIDECMAMDYEINCGFGLGPFAPNKPEPVKSACFKSKVRTKCTEIIKEKEGNTPMAYETTTKTDTQIQRDYLKGRLRDARYDVRSNVETMFNLHVNQNPKSYKELIDWITNGKYTLDTKITAKIDGLVAAGDWFSGPFEGIKWTGSGKPTDYDGYTVAIDELEKLYTTTMDTIIVADPTTGLAALQAFEAFVPSNAPVAATTTTAS